MVISSEQFSALAAIPDLILKKEESLSQHTTMQVGGPAELFLLPESQPALASAIKKLTDLNIPFNLLGEGSNIIPADAGIKGAIISTCRLTSCNIVRENRLVKAEAGIKMTDFCQQLAEAGLGGLEFASGIPGTLGGAIFMNAGAYGGEIKDHLQGVEVLNTAGKSHELSVEELELGYRSSLLQREKLFAVRATFKLKSKSPEKIKQRIAELKERRWAKQPMNKPSSGSAFKRPPGHYAGKLIEEAGFKGFQLGGAKVSEKHAGFIINTGQATAQDIIRLMSTIQKKVQEQFGVLLEPEPRFIGEFDELP